ncbi:MAG: recombinase family protein [Pirellulaceae bacterium]|nr:recombinase family protein [Pirellulaceae bacterium]
MKRFVALARVSSREQEREGFSLEIQEDALKAYALREGGQIVELFRIAETASKSDERKAFRELVRYAKKNAAKLDGLLFYKLDRAARNLFDYVELERLESEYGLPFISVSQPTESSPAGRMMRRTLANMASFYTEQQSVDVREGISRRVQEGWFAGKAPYGYLNVRVNGRSVVQIDPEAAPKIRRLFQLFAYENHTLDTLVEALSREGFEYRKSARKFPRSKLHTILRDRSYIGEVPYCGNWYAGKQEPIIDRATWSRVQKLLGEKVYHAYELTYAGGLITCGHCGHFITGEQVRKKTKAGENIHVYYRCSKYRTEGHPNVRLREAEIDEQVLRVFAAIRIDDDAHREWFAMVLRSQTRDSQEQSKSQREDLQRQLTKVLEQQDRLLNLRILDEIDADTFAAKKQELRDRESELKLDIEVADRSHHEIADLVMKVFELSQSLSEKWLTADYAEKRKILEIVCLNLELNDASLCVSMRKPFDVLAKGLSVPSSRAGGI